MLKLGGVTKRLGGRVVLDGVSLSVAPGECVGLIGPNGAGKTTLLRLAAGFSKPDAGVIQRPARIAAVLQPAAGLAGELTGREAFALACALHDMPCDLAALAAFAGLEGDLDRPLSSYSAGMRLRLSMAAALHAEPDLLILDEVLMAGDADFRSRCYAAIARVPSVLLCTQALREAAFLCHRAVLLEAGKVAFDGPLEGALSRYAPERTLPRVGAGTAKLTVSGSTVRVEASGRIRLSLRDGEGLLVGESDLFQAPVTLRFQPPELRPGTYWLGVSVYEGERLVLREPSAAKLAVAGERVSAGSVRLVCEPVLEAPGAGRVVGTSLEQPLP